MVKYAKEEAKDRFLETIRKSWTYHRLTEDEAARFEKIVERDTNEKFDGCIKGNFRERWFQLQNIYHAFLVGLGYPDDTCMDWRGDKTTI